MAEHENALAVLVDFENMARPGAKGRGDFDIHLVLNRLAEKGRVLVKRAYADWSRYRDARHELQNAGLGLIEMPSAREGAKNRADIQMAVDAMELAYSREHVNNFVIVSGDSDFTPLVGKLRELNKRVIGVGNRESASELLIANCDEFIFYDRLAAEAVGGTTTRRRGGSSSADLNPVELLRETLTALQREGVEWPLASIVKDSMRRKYPAFDESEHGFGTFSKFLEEASKTGLVRLETDPRSGTYRVELAEGRAMAIPPLPTRTEAVAERGGEETEGGRRRRRRGGRGRTPAEAAADGGSDDVTTEALEPGSEVFEVVITPTPDLDLGTLPPLDEPISYEDMIMLGPEVGEDVPDLAEASDVAAGGPPARSARRRRRRGAGADPEPTIDDLEVVEPDELAPVAEEEPAEEPVLAVVVEGDEEEPATAPRRRRRRKLTAGDEAAAPAAGEAPEVAEPVDAEATADAPAEAVPVEEPVPSAGRRRVRRRATTEAVGEPAPGAEVVAEAAEAPAEAVAEEAPKPRRRTRARAAAAAEEPVAEAEAPAEEAPKPKRRTRAKAAVAAEEPSGDAPAEAVAEEAPKPKRRTRAKAAVAAEDAAPGAEVPAEDAPKPKRRTRAKAAVAAE